jgi:hypothetical protein
MLLFTAVSLLAAAQKSKPFDAFKAKFRTDTLPYCAEYTEDQKEFFNPPEFDFKHYPGKMAAYINDSLMLSVDWVKQFLYPNEKRVVVYDLRTGDTLYTDSITAYIARHTFYANGILVKNMKFIGLIVERLETDGSEKYLCTFDRDGKLLSKLSLGYYLHSGSYAMDDAGLRAPYYEEKTGCIDTDLTIKVKLNHTDSRYTVMPDGKIVEVK